MHYKKQLNEISDIETSNNIKQLEAVKELHKHTSFYLKLINNLTSDVW